MVGVGKHAVLVQWKMALVLPFFLSIFHSYLHPKVKKKKRIPAHFFFLEKCLQSLPSQLVLYTQLLSACFVLAVLIYIVFPLPV